MFVTVPLIIALCSVFLNIICLIKISALGQKLDKISVKVSTEWRTQRTEETPLLSGHRRGQIETYPVETGQRLITHLNQSYPVSNTGVQAKQISMQNLKPSKTNATDVKHAQREVKTTLTGASHLTRKLSEQSSISAQKQDSLVIDLASIQALSEEDPTPVRMSTNSIELHNWSTQLRAVDQPGPTIVVAPSVLSSITTRSVASSAGSVSAWEKM